MKTLSYVLSLFLASAAALWSQGSEPVVVTPTTSISIEQGQLSQPLTLQISTEGTFQPLAGVAVAFSSDTPSLVLLSPKTTTDSTGTTSVVCFGILPTTGHILATGPTGGLAVFTVVVTPPVEGSPILSIPNPGRIVWQGTSTLGQGNSFSVQLSSSDAPVADTTLSVSVVSGNAQLVTSSDAGTGNLTVMTGSDGVAYFDVAFPNTQDVDDFSIIQVATNGAYANFLVHAVAAGTAPTATLTAPGTVALAAGVAAGVPIQLQVATEEGLPLYGVSVSIQSNGDSSVTCVEPVLITAPDGTFSCHPIISGKAGKGAMSLMAGGSIVSPALPYALSPSAVAEVQNLSGNFQYGSTGGLVRAPLVVRLTDGYGNPVAGSTVNWMATGAIFVNQQIFSDKSGLASATVELGNQPGPVSIMAGSGGVLTQFTLKNTSNGSLLQTSGNQQTGNVSESFPAPLMIRAVHPDGSPWVKRSISFSVIEGAAQLVATLAVTDNNGYASTAVRAGQSAGRITIRANDAAEEADFVLWAQLPAANWITLTDWNGRPAAVTPGSLMKVEFSALGALAIESQAFTSIPYPTSVEGVVVSVNGTPAPILSIEERGLTVRLTVQIPWELAGSAKAAVGVSTSQGYSKTPDMPVESIHPVIADGSLTADRKSFVLKVMGAGPLTPLASTDSLGLSSQTTRFGLEVRIDGEPVQVTGVEADTTLPGVVNVRVAKSKTIGSGRHRFSAIVEAPTGFIEGPAAEIDVP